MGSDGGAVTWSDRWIVDPVPAHRRVGLAGGPRRRRRTGRVGRWSISRCWSPTWPGWSAKSRR